MKTAQAFFVLIFIVVSSMAMAIPHPNKKAFIEGGLYRGGQSGYLQTLLAVEKQSFKNMNAERIRLVFGNDKGLKSKQPMGYFHVQHDVKNNRVVIDIAQMAASRVNEDQIRRILVSSSSVANVSFTADPEDNSSTLVLNLKKPVLLRVVKQKTKFGPALALDLRPKK